MTGSPLDGVRLVALDLDGTLLPSDKRLTDRAKRVVRDLEAAGIAVTLATGRGWTFTERYGRELGVTRPLVSFEGALVALPADAADAADAQPATNGDRAPGRVFHRRLLAEERIRGILAAVADLGLGYFVCVEGGRTVASRHLADRLEQVAIWDPHVDVVELHLDPGARGYILHLIGEPGAVREALRRVQAQGHGDVDTFHGEFWDGFDQLQVRPSGIGKDVGLRHVMDHLGIGPEHVLAAGDWLNDLAMLRMARVAVAPANAAAQVRDIADHVLAGTCDDEAVPRFLEDALAAF